MSVSRRTFLRYCALSAGALGLDATKLGLLQSALASPTAPPVIWLHGSSCLGCSISFLNRISDQVPRTAAEVLADTINLTFHSTLMSLAGESSVTALRATYDQGGYILVVEGGVPVAFDGAACTAYNVTGRDVPFQQALQEYAARAAHLVCVGTCASFGGIPASGGNLTGVAGVRALTGRATVNLPGCPTHPDWIVWALAQLIAGQPVPLDAHGRPDALYAAYGPIHDSCPRNLGGGNEAADFGEDGHCLIDLGCRGPETQANCQDNWNGRAGAGCWCIGVNAPCHGCVEPTFPGTHSFFERYVP